MKKITYFVGFNDRETKEPIENAKEKLIEIAQRHFEGFTIFDTIGCWQKELEKGCGIIIYNDSPVDVINFTDFECDVLFEMNQQAITREIGESIQFIDRDDEYIKIWRKN